MKKKLVTFIITGIFAVSLAACGNTQTTDTAENNADQMTNQETEENQAEPEQRDNKNTLDAETDTEEAKDDAEKSTDEVSDKNENTDLTFEDLSKYSFEFCSGAGGWSTDFEIEKDGSFNGLYHDSDMGDTGEGYENGTIYSCNFSGDFTDLTKMNDYTYEMKMADISYENTPGEEEIVDNVKYIYTDVYGLEGTDTFKVYLTGTPVSELSEEVYFWVQSANHPANDDSEDQTEDKLTIPIIVNEEMQYGIYSYERQTPYEEAKMNLENYKTSYEELEEQLSTNAATQVEMDNYSQLMYENSDDCLNLIWHLIKYNTTEEEFNEILNEQRKWIADKEAAGNEILDKNNGSSAQMDYNLKLAELTMERCEELIEYLK